MGNYSTSQTPSPRSSKQKRSIVGTTVNTSEPQTPVHFNPLDPRSPLKNRTPIFEHSNEERKVTNANVVRSIIKMTPAKLATESSKFLEFASFESHPMTQKKGDIIH
jgi:hypothetical protein